MLYFGQINNVYVLQGRPCTLSISNKTVDHQQCSNKIFLLDWFFKLWSIAKDVDYADGTE